MRFLQVFLGVFFLINLAPRGVLAAEPPVAPLVRDTLKAQGAADFFVVLRDDLLALEVLTKPNKSPRPAPGGSLSWMN